MLKKKNDFLAESIQIGNLLRAISETSDGDLILRDKFFPQGLRLKDIGGYDVSLKINKVLGATENNFVVFDGTGGIKDSSLNANDLVYTSDIVSLSGNVHQSQIDINQLQQDIQTLSFLSLTDTPTSFSNADGYILTVSGGKVIFTDPESITTAVDMSMIIAISGSLDELESRVTDVEYNVANISSLIDASISGVFQGVVHVTNVTNSGNIQKTYLANTNNSVIDSFISDTANVNIELTSRSFTKDWLPVVTLNGSSVNSWTEQTNGKFKATIPLTLNGSQIIAQYVDGTDHIITYSLATAGPSVLTANLGTFPVLSWDGGSNQTTLKQSDVVNITGTCENSTTFVEVVDDSGSIFASGNTVVTQGVTNFSLNGTVSNRTGSKTLKLRARNSLGTWGATFTGVTATLDQASPVIGASTITYPVSQGALKNSETATVTSTVTDYTSIVYSSPTSELNIANTTTYENIKTVTRSSGSYNVSSNNFRIEARKASNGKTTTTNSIVFIANVGATINVTTANSRLRSGGNDGTSVQNHTITATSTQRLTSFSMLGQNTYGTFIGSWLGASNNTSWTRTLQVTDNNPKGSASFNTLSAVNLANIETTVINSGSTYILGGFVSRTLTLPAFANEVASNVNAVDYSKVTLTWSVKSLPIKSTLGDNTTPQANTWCLSTLTPASVRILDTSATNSSSQASTVVLEETV
jgi:hypothetical protein